MVEKTKSKDNHTTYKNGNDILVIESDDLFSSCKARDAASIYRWLIPETQKSQAFEFILKGGHVRIADRGKPLDPC